VWEKARFFFMAQTYVAFELTGAYVLDHLSASMFDPMYSPKTQDWISEWAELVARGLPLPELRYSNEIAGHVTAEGARLSGLPEGIPVGVGSTDAFSEALSVGVKDPGDVMLMYGSTIVADLIADRFMSHRICGRSPAPTATLSRWPAGCPPPAR
jgi:xylulokinase